MVRKVLVCISGLPYSQAALALGDLMAQINDAEMELLTVIENESERTAAEGMLAEAAKTLKTTAVSHKVRLGKPTIEIMGEASVSGSDMLVVGAHVAGGWVDYLLQSITHQVADHANSSVLVANEELTSLKRIMICHSGDALAEAAVVVGGRLAQAAQAEVKLLHVSKALPAMYSGLSTMEETVSELLESGTPLAYHLGWAKEHLETKGINAEVKVRYGEVSPEIMDEAQQWNCDLIVIGEHPSTPWIKNILSPNIAMQVAKKASRSVLIVR